MLPRLATVITIVCIASGSSHAQSGAESLEVGLISSREAGDIVIGIDTASVVDGSAIVFDMSVMNRSEESTLFLVSARESVVLVSGERDPRQFEIFGLASCFHPADHCIAYYEDVTWTVLAPGVLYEFRIAADDSGSGTAGGRASVNLRAFSQTADGRVIHDIPFARIPVSD
ncbi:MAG: hypothetical protein H6843_14000 [Rhodospirillaceae bacterium]|nr:hypothetical protein [Rhodospirillaceae bacterium]